MGCDYIDYGWVGFEGFELARDVWWFGENESSNQLHVVTALGEVGFVGIVLLVMLQTGVQAGGSGHGNGRSLFAVVSFSWK